MKKRTVIALAALSLMAVSGTTVFAATKPVMETEDTADSELFMPGEIKEDAEEAEFEGNWKAVEVGIDKSIASLDTIGFDSVYATAEDGKVNVYVKMTLLDNLLKIEDADYDYQDVGILVLEAPCRSDKLFSAHTQIYFPAHRIIAYIPLFSSLRKGLRNPVFMQLSRLKCAFFIHHFAHFYFLQLIILRVNLIRTNEM